MIQDLSGSWCIKGTGESALVMDSPVPLLYHDPDRSWITDPDRDYPKGTQPYIIHLMYGPEGNNLFCFPESPDVSQDEVEGNIRTRGKTKLTSFPRDHTLSVLLYI